MHETAHVSPKPTFENEPTPVLPIACFVAPADVRRLVRQRDHEIQERLRAESAAVRAARRRRQS